MSLPNAPVSVGEVLAGKYRTERVLGIGGMGVVVEATHLQLEKRVALKFLHTQSATHPDMHARFLREARAAVHLKSQHIAQVMDVGTLDGGAPFMVMEMLQGSDLEALLVQRGRLPIPEAVEYILQACEAVGEAHRRGIVHRDLKPANLFLTTDADGSAMVKVLDFGVSKVTGIEHQKLTADGQMVGSPLYMSPEQMLGRDDVDTRTDIWALGVILYELIAGLNNTPFGASTYQGLQTNVLVKPPAPLTKYVREVPAELETALLRCLDKTPARRWPDVAAFASALVPLASARAAPYAERVARVRGVKVAPRPGGETLTREQALSRASEPAANASGLLMSATTGGATSQVEGTAPRRWGGPFAAGVGTAFILLLATGLGVWRWHAPAEAHPVSEASGMAHGGATPSHEAAAAATPSAATPVSARSAAPPPAVTPAPASAATPAPAAPKAPPSSSPSAAPAPGSSLLKPTQRPSAVSPQPLAPQASSAAPDIFVRGTRGR